MAYIQGIAAQDFSHSCYCLEKIETGSSIMVHEEGGALHPMHYECGISLTRAWGENRFNPTTSVCPSCRLNITSINGISIDEMRITQEAHLAIQEGLVNARSARLAHFAAAEDLDNVREMLGLPDITTEERSIALTAAASNENILVVEELIRSGQISEEGYRKAYDQALEHRRPNIAILLVTRFAFDNYYLGNAIYAAVELGYVEVVEALLPKNGDYSARQAFAINSHRNMVDSMKFAAAQGNLEMMRLLFRHYDYSEFGNLDKSDLDGIQFDSTNGGYPHIVQHIKAMRDTIPELVRCGRDTTDVTILRKLLNNQAPLQEDLGELVVLAAERKYFWAVKELLSDNREISPQYRGRAVLKAVQLDESATVRLLLLNGEISEDDRDAAIELCEEHNQESTKKLLQNAELEEDIFYDAYEVATSAAEEVVSAFRPSFSRPDKTSLQVLGAFGLTLGSGLASGIALSSGTGLAATAIIAGKGAVGTLSAGLLTHFLASVPDRTITVVGNVLYKRTGIRIASPFTNVFWGCSMLVGGIIAPVVSGAIAGYRIGNDDQEDPLYGIPSTSAKIALTSIAISGVVACAIVAPRVVRNIYQRINPPEHDA